MSDVRGTRRFYINKRYKVLTTLSNSKAVKKSDIVIFAIKPQGIKCVLRELKPDLKNKLIISIAAAIKIDYIKKAAGAKRIIRVMPNTPALAGYGITAICSDRNVKTSDLKIADEIFGSVGKTVHLKEKYIDAVTAVSGSGPAYFYLLMEAMTEAAISSGINRRIAEGLVSQTALGASVLQQASKLSSSALRKKVTSKGGTTEAALKVFERKGFKEIVKDAIKAAKKRAQQLSE